jgi:hypothetical protein
MTYLLFMVVIITTKIKKSKEDGEGEGQYAPRLCRGSID